jgi:hypothetical protein
MNELMDQLDEAMQDLSEAGFDDAAEMLYDSVYEQDQESVARIATNVGEAILSIHNRYEGDLPENVTRRLVHCMELARRFAPDAGIE